MLEIVQFVQICENNFSIFGMKVGTKVGMKVGTKVGMRVGMEIFAIFSILGANLEPFAPEMEGQNFTHQQSHIQGIWCEAPGC